VTARAPDGPRAYALPQPEKAGAWLGRLVAYHEIRGLQETIGAEGERADWVARVKELALEHGFVTDYTSLVVTLEPRGRPAMPEQDAARAVTLSTTGAPSVATPVALSPAVGQPSAPSQDASFRGRAEATPSAQVPGPGAALLVLASLAALALAGARRRR
jgi:hypothetical protein